MTDEEAERLLPVVHEFVEAVAEEDFAFIASCLSHKNRAPAIAVWCARLLLDAERLNAQHEAHISALADHARRLAADNARLRRQADEAMARVNEWRQIMTAREATRERRERKTA